MSEQKLDLTKYKEFMAIPDAEKRVRLLILDDQAVAYAWINAYLDQLNGMIDSGEAELDFDELMKTAISQFNDQWGDYIVRGGSFEGFSIDPMFWTCFFKLLQLPDTGKHPGFFSCSC